MRIPNVRLGCTFLPRVRTAAVLANPPNPSFLRPNAALSLRRNLCYTVRKSAEGGLSYGTQMGICRVLWNVHVKNDLENCGDNEVVQQIPDIRFNTPELFVE